jgi:hypothetical protein
MPRRNHIPAYRLHKQSGQATVTLPDGLGGRRDFTLGEYGSPESRAEYARLLAQWEANNRRMPQPAAVADGSINEREPSNCYTPAETATAAPFPSPSFRKKANRLIFFRKP